MEGRKVGGSDWAEQGQRIGQEEGGWRVVRMRNLLEKPLKSEISRSDVIDAQWRRATCELRDSLWCVKKCSVSNLMKDEHKKWEMWGLLFPFRLRIPEETLEKMTNQNRTEVFALVTLVKLVSCVSLLEAPAVSRETTRLSLFRCSLRAPTLSSIWHTSVNWGTCLTSLLVYKDVQISGFIFVKWQQS